MKTVSKLRAGVALALLLGHPSLVRADPDEASMLLRQGVELRRANRKQEALDAYSKAFALSPTPAVRAQLALAEQALARWIEAERDLDLALASSDPWVEKNRTALEEAREVVRQHLAWLTVDVDVPDAEVEIDGRPILQGAETRVLAGSGVLAAHAQERAPDIRRLSLGPGEHVHARIALAAAVPPAPAALEPLAFELPPNEPLPGAPPALAAPPSRAPVGPIALGVLGLAGIGLGAYFGVHVLEDKSDERAQCAPRCTPAAANDYSDAQGFATASNIAFGAGLGLAAGGAVWWLLARDKTSARAGAIRIEPSIGASMTGLVLRGSL